MHEYMVKLRNVTELHTVIARNVTFGEHFVVFIDQHGGVIAGYATASVYTVRRKGAGGDETTA